MDRILVIDDHPIVRKGIVALLSQNGSFFICEEAANADEAHRKVLSGRYSLALLDISLGSVSGLDLLPRLLSAQPHLRILVLSMYPEEEYAVRALTLGAAGYLTKEAAPAELMAAVNRVLSGGRYITSGVAEKLIDHLIVPKRDRLPHENLSARELQILRMIGNGQSPSCMAETLFLSVKTISTYRKRLLDKLNLSTTADIIRYAIKHDLLR